LALFLTDSIVDGEVLLLVGAGAIHGFLFVPCLSFVFRIVVRLSKQLNFGAPEPLILFMASVVASVFTIGAILVSLQLLNMLPLKGRYPIYVLLFFCSALLQKIVFSAGRKT
jgi:hypothetical protein